MAALVAVLVEDHAHDETGAVLALAQRAQIVGDALGQHRHDAVGEVDRVAAQLRLAVELGAGAHEVRDVGDGDEHDPAALVAAAGVGLGVDGVVVVARVGRVDGDKRHCAQVGAP